MGSLVLLTEGYGETRSVFKEKLKKQTLCDSTCLCAWKRNYERGFGAELVLYISIRSFE